MNEEEEKLFIERVVRLIDDFDIDDIAKISLIAMIGSCPKLTQNEKWKKYIFTDEEITNMARELFVGNWHLNMDIVKEK